MNREIDIARLIQQDRINHQTGLAWRIEAIRLQTQHQKRLPNLSSLLVEGQAPTIHDQRAAQRAAWLAFADHYGIPVRTVH